MPMSVVLVIYIIAIIRHANHNQNIVHGQKINVYAESYVAPYFHFGSSSLFSFHLYIYIYDIYTDIHRGSYKPNTFSEAIMSERSMYCRRVATSKQADRGQGNHTKGSISTRPSEI